MLSIRAWAWALNAGSSSRTQPPVLIGDAWFTWQAGPDSPWHDGATLLLARWMLFAAVAVAALIGVQHVTRGTAVRHVHGVGAFAHHK